MLTSLRPWAFVVIVSFGLLFTAGAIVLDTAFYRPEIETFRDVLSHPVITPLNNFLYNALPENLAQHGLHPIYQHVFANLPLLLGPAFLLLPFFYYRTIRLVSALSGVFVLSLFPHQEARFLIPAVPLFLSSIKFPAKFARHWIAAWVVFNLALGILMGTYHQGGVVPMQIHLAAQDDIKLAFWWKTYSPPIWLLDGKSQKMNTTDLKGGDADWMVRVLLTSVSCKKRDDGVVLIAPGSATFLDQFQNELSPTKDLVLEPQWTYRRHLNLDDIDIPTDGIWGTLQRVVGRRGLVLYDVKRRC